MSRRVIALLSLAVVLTACGRSAIAPPSAGAYRVIVYEMSSSSPSGRITVRDSRTGAIERTWPVGTPSPDWSRYYVVTSAGSASRLAAVDPISGLSLGQATIPDGYLLPQLNFIGPTSGLSPNGQWLALTGTGLDATGQTVTSFLVGASALTQPFTEIHLLGRFDFDALSNDGQSLYLIEPRKEQGHYVVRLYDVAKHVLSDQVVVDKFNPSEAMAGIRGDSVTDAHGDFAYTVYARANGGSFIHALPLDQPFAYCVDLPTTGADGVEQQFLWSLAMTHDGSTLYGVNGSLGRLAVISLGGAPQVKRESILAMKPSTNPVAGLVVNAEAKGSRIGGAALSTDGRTLYAVADNGIIVIDTATLKIRSRWLDTQAIWSIRVSSDGKWLFAADTGSNQVLQLDAKTGSVVNHLDGIDNVSAVLWTQAM